MKPAMWIAAAFATGIALMMRSPHHPLLYAALTARAILAGGIFIWRRLLFAAAICALAAWTALGGLALTIEQAAVPANHVTRLIASKRLFARGRRGIFSIRARLTFTAISRGRKST
jgi:hypothetical protein